MRIFIFFFSSELVRQYTLLYTKNRTDTLEALDGLSQLKHAHALKAKILFSIIVVSILTFHNLIIPFYDNFWFEL